MELKPLVSVVIVTYNSSKFIIETLDSVKEQTYSNIELIISDDYSKDNTIELCEQWRSEHCKRFRRIQIIKSEKNTGISANGNRGFLASKGLWIKGLAGDDLIIPTAIEEFVNHINIHKEKLVVFSKIDLFGNLSNEEQYFYWENNYKLFDKLRTVKEQLFQLKFSNNFIPATSLFIRKDFFKIIGGFDEDISLLDDRPLWIKCLQHGQLLTIINQRLVNYRLSDSSIQSNKRMKIAYSIFRIKYVFENKNLSNFFVKSYRQLDEKNLINNFLYLLYMCIEQLHTLKLKLCLQKTNKLT